MEYPQNNEEAWKAVETYEKHLLEPDSILSVNLENVSPDKGEGVLISDILLVGDLESASQMDVCIKSLSFVTGEYDKSHTLEVQEIVVDLKRFLAAADAIREYIYSRKELDGIV